MELSSDPVTTNLLSGLNLQKKQIAKINLKNNTYLVLFVCLFVLLYVSDAAGPLTVFVCHFKLRKIGIAFHYHYFAIDKTKGQVNTIRIEVNTSDWLFQLVRAHETLFADIPHFQISFKSDNFNNNISVIDLQSQQLLGPIYLPS